MLTASLPNQLLILSFLQSLLIAHEFGMRRKQGSSEAINTSLAATNSAGVTAPPMTSQRDVFYRALRKMQQTKDVTDKLSSLLGAHWHNRGATCWKQHWRLFLSQSEWATQSSIYSNVGESDRWLNTLRQKPDVINTVLKPPCVGCDPKKGPH